VEHSQGDKDTDAETLHALTQITDQPPSAYDSSVLNQWLLMRSRPRLIASRPHTTIPAPLTDQPLQSVSDLKITDLLSFLQKYQASCPDLQTICPLFEIPFPSIDFKLDSSIGLSVKIEFSLRSSKALMQYVLALLLPTRCVGMSL